MKRLQNKTIYMDSLNNNRLTSSQELPTSASMGCWWIDYSGVPDDGETAFNPGDDYDYILNPAENVPAIVRQYADVEEKIWTQAPSSITVDINGGGVTGNTSDVVITNYESTEDKKFYRGKFGIHAFPAFTVYSNDVTPIFPN